MKRAASIILSFFCFVTALAQTHQHGSQPSGDGNFNPSVVSDTRGGFYLAYIRRANGSSNVMIRHSTDGKSFSEPVRVNDREGDATVRNENPPKVAVASNGNVYVCWANERARWKGNIRFAGSTDGGKSFSPSITINSDAEKEPTGHAFQSVAVDKTGRVYVAWIDERNKKAGDRGAEIWMSQSVDGGKTFSTDHKIISDVCECCRTNIQIDSAGRLFLAYRTVPAKGPMYRDIVVARSGNGGKSFAPVKVGGRSMPARSQGRGFRLTVAGRSRSCGSRAERGKVFTMPRPRITELRTLRASFWNRIRTWANTRRRSLWQMAVFSLRGMKRWKR